MKQHTITLTQYTELLSAGVVMGEHGTYYLIPALDQVHRCLFCPENNLEKGYVVNFRWRGKTKYQI